MVRLGQVRLGKVRYMKLVPNMHYGMGRYVTLDLALLSYVR